MVALVAVTVAMLGYFAVNVSAVAMVIAVAERKPFLAVLARPFGLTAFQWAGNLAMGILGALTWDRNPAALPALAACLAEGADVIALVKPQFEVGRGEVGKGGIVTDPLKHRRVLTEVARVAASLGLSPLDVIQSPILGAEGNREFLIHLQKRRDAEVIEPAMEAKIVTLTA